jgi:hypothetical protein
VVIGGGFWHQHCQKGKYSNFEFNHEEHEEHKEFEEKKEKKIITDEHGAKINIKIALLYLW